MDFQNILESINTYNHKNILLFPIGPPGSGKSLLKIYLINNVKDRIVIAPSRDDIYSKFRQTNGKKKTKNLTNQHMIDMITNVDITSTSTSTNKYLIYIDSTNSHQKLRQLYIDIVKPDIIRYILFQTNHLDNAINYLVNRTINRNHPTFPTDKTEQINKITKILDNIEYPIDSKENFNIYI